MTDIFEASKRSEIMSHVRGKNSRPEMIVRRALHKSGLRYRIHSKSVPGHPDVSIKKFKIALFVNGCFWHGHEGCRYAYVPKSNRDFWIKKIDRNRARDENVHSELLREGWHIFIVWECELRKEHDATIPDVIRKIRQIIESST